MHTRKNIIITKKQNKQQQKNKNKHLFVRNSRSLQSVVTQQSEWTKVRKGACRFLTWTTRWREKWWWRRTVVSSQKRWPADGRQKCRPRKGRKMEKRFATIKRKLHFFLEVTPEDHAPHCQWQIVKEYYNLLLPADILELLWRIKADGVSKREMQQQRKRRTLSSAEIRKERKRQWKRKRGEITKIDREKRKN